MKEFGDIEQFLIMIIGKEEYELFISEIIRKHKEKLSIKNYESIIYVYGILIFLIGMDKNAIKVDKIKLKMNDKTENEIKIKDLCKKYSKYIEKIEKYKYELLKKGGII